MEEQYRYKKVICDKCEKEAHMTTMAQKILCECGNLYINPNFSEHDLKYGLENMGVTD